MEEVLAGIRGDDVAEPNRATAAFMAANYFDKKGQSWISATIEMAVKGPSTLLLTVKQTQDETVIEVRICINVETAEIREKPTNKNRRIFGLIVVSARHHKRRLTR